MMPIQDVPSQSSYRGLETPRAGRGGGSINNRPAGLRWALGLRCLLVVLAFATAGCSSGPCSLALPQDKGKILLTEAFARGAIYLLPLSI